MAAIHSSVLSRVSRAKSCRCVTSRAMRYVIRASELCEFIRRVLGVMLWMVKSSSGGALAPLLGSCAMVARGVSEDFTLLSLSLSSLSEYPARIRRR